MRHYALANLKDIRESMPRNRERRSFTVAAKSSGHQGFVSIPAKAPRVPQPTPRKPPALGPWAEAAEVAPAAAPSAIGTEPRRILPNLNAWEAPAPAPAPDVVAEPPLPRVRRPAPQGTFDGAPRRRGRPRKVPLSPDPPAPALHEPEPVPALAAPRVELAPMRAAPVPAPRKARPTSETLRLGERWKRRLPRACW